MLLKLTYDDKIFSDMLYSFKLGIVFVPMECLYDDSTQY